MIYHLVFIKHKPDTTADAIQKLIEQAQTLKGIPGVVDVKAGKNVTERAKGFQLGVVVIMEKQTDIPVYAEHPLHKAFASTYIVPIKEDLMVMDVETA